MKLPLGTAVEKAIKPQDLGKVFDKFGNTVYMLAGLSNKLPAGSYLPPSAVSRLRRELTEALDSANRATYRYDYRRKENKDYDYPSERLDERDNVANSFAERFYRSHGVKDISHALETDRKVENGTIVMTTRYCLRHELGCCKKERNYPGADRFSEPLTISSGNNRFRLDFDCARCEMNVILDK